MLIKKYGSGTSAQNFKSSLKKKKFRFPVAFHLIQAVGALTLHTGVGTICYTIGIKNANGIVGELTRLYKLECTANIGRILLFHKLNYTNYFYCSLFNAIII